MQETWIHFFSWEDPLEMGMTTQPCILTCRIPMWPALAGYSPRGLKELDMLGNFHFYYHVSLVVKNPL